MSAIAIPPTDVAELLSSLLSREVEVEVGDAAKVEPHPATYRGLVGNDNTLMAVIGADLAFAHRSGGALAMVPAASVEERLDDPDADLLLFYREVANVLVRLVDEATDPHLRIDPGIEHEPDTLQTLISAGQTATRCQVSIDGYGLGTFGIWYRTS